MFPSSISLREYIRYLPSQNNINCCVASATLLAAEIMMAKSGKEINFSRLYLYYMTRKFYNKLDQKKIRLKETLDTFIKCGVALEEKWPFNYDNVNIEPPMQVIQEAVYNRLVSYESISLSNYKEYLNLGIPIIIGMNIGEKFWSLSGKFEEHNYKPINGTDNKLDSGHAMTIIGYDDNINGGSWIIANSLGPKWGYQGYGAIPYECNQDIGESYILTGFSGITIGK